MNDTAPNIEEIVQEMFRKKTGEERLRMGFAMFDDAKKIVLASFPATDITRIKQLTFLRFYGEEFEESQKARIIAHLSSHP